MRTGFSAKNASRLFALFLYILIYPYYVHDAVTLTEKHRAMQEPACKLDCSAIYSPELSSSFLNTRIRSPTTPFIASIE